MQNNLFVITFINTIIKKLLTMYNRESLFKTSKFVDSNIDTIINNNNYLMQFIYNNN